MTPATFGAPINIRPRSDLLPLDLSHQRDDDDNNNNNNNLIMNADVIVHSQLPAVPNEASSSQATRLHRPQLKQRCWTAAAKRRLSSLTHSTRQTCRTVRSSSASRPSSLRQPRQTWPIGRAREGTFLSSRSESAASTVLIFPLESVPEAPRVSLPAFSCVYILTYIVSTLHCTFLRPNEQHSPSSPLTRTFRPQSVSGCTQLAEKVSPQAHACVCVCIECRWECLMYT